MSDNGDASGADVEPDETIPPGFSQRMALGFSAQFLFIGLYLPYFPLWLQSKALSPLEISTILAIPLAVRVLTTGQVMVHADRQPDRASLLTRLQIAGFAAILLYWWSDGFWPILLVTLIFNFFFNPILPLLDAITLSGVRRFHADYGRIRLWGSLVFILANLGGGALLAGFSPSAILVSVIIAMGLGLLAAFQLPRIGRVRPPGSVKAEQVTRRKLLANRTFMTVLAASGLAQASHALLYGFGSIHWQSVGVSGAGIGVFWAIGVIAEIILFQYASPVLRKHGAIAIIAIGCIGGVVRWLLFPLVDGEVMFGLLQVLHGLSFGAVHIGTMHFIMDAVPEENIGAAQGTGYVLGGMAMGLAIFASGPIYNGLGVLGFWIMAVLCAFALMLLWSISPKDRAKVG